MLGMLINEREKDEIIYMLKREMDEILFDLEDTRIEPMVKKSMQDRYKTLFTLFKRIATHEECIKYMLPAKKKIKG
ncbi:MAG TPA: hypothetical protein VIG80_04350 [Bacillaceae bacterium]